MPCRPPIVNASNGCKRASLGVVQAIAVGGRGRLPVRSITVTPIVRPSLHDEVVVRLRDMIVEGELSPGQRIPERTLCDSFGISRTPLREALKVVAAEGLIELLHNRGARVKVLSAAEVQDMLEAMAGLESYAGELACGRASDDELAAIRELHQRMLRCYGQRRRRDYFALNQEIHAAIVQAAGNRSLSQLHAALRVRMRRVRYIGNNVPEQWQDAVQDHERILQALLARRPEALSAALRQHFTATWRRVARLVVAESAGQDKVESGTPPAALPPARPRSATAARRVASH
jgi:DNA-binding GntR family transcriptional regulator